MGESVWERERERGRDRVYVVESVWKRVCGREWLEERVWERWERVWVGQGERGREIVGERGTGRVWESLGERECGRDRECGIESGWERVWEEWVGERMCVGERECGGKVGREARAGGYVGSGNEGKWVGRVCGREKVGKRIWERAWESESLGERDCLEESVWEMESFRGREFGRERACGRECVEESVWKRVCERDGRECGRESVGQRVCGRVCGRERGRECLGERECGRESVWERESVVDSVCGGESVCGRESVLERERECV